MSKKVVLTQLNELELVKGYLIGDMDNMNSGNSNMTNDEVMAKATQIRIRGGLLERITETIKVHPDHKGFVEKVTEDKDDNNNNEENE